MPIGGTAFMGENQHPRLTTTYLNQLNRTGDPAPGLNVGGRTDMVNGGQVGFSGMIAQPYDGFAGGKLTITNPWAVQFADPQVGPLYGGVYQYCQVDPAATAPLVRGGIVFWLDEDILEYVVSAAGQSGTPLVPRKVAGIAVNNTLPGHWDFIQIAGIAMVLFTTPGTVGQAVSFNPAATPPIPILGGAMNENFIGTTRLTAPAVNSLSPVKLGPYNF